MVELTWLQLGRISVLFYQSSDFHTVINLSVTVQVLPMHMLTLLSVDEILLPRYVNQSINFSGEKWSIGLEVFIHQEHFNTCANETLTVSENIL